MSIVSLMIVIAFGSPPHQMESRSTLQRYANAGIETQGRDPLAGTGLCGPLLPVRVPDDVYYVSFPARGFNDDHLRLLNQFPNLTQVRCRRVLTEAEHDLIEANVPTGTYLLYTVRSQEGTIAQQHSLRARYRFADEDINGDGIVDENDAE